MIVEITGESKTLLERVNYYLNTGYVVTLLDNGDGTVKLLASLRRDESVAELERRANHTLLKVETNV